MNKVSWMSELFNNERTFQFNMENLHFFDSANKFYFLLPSYFRRSMLYLVHKQSIQ